MAMWDQVTTSLSSNSSVVKRYIFTDSNEKIMIKQSNAI